MVSQTRTLRPAAAPAAGPAAYLLVCESERAWTFDLPRDSVVVIGRSEDADLRIDDASVSRRHARIISVDGETRISDVGSHNGTLVNGEPVEGARVVGSGDVIAIGTATLVLRGDSRQAARRPVADFAGLRGRLEEELERALDYQRPLAVIAWALAGLTTDRGEASELVMRRLRLIDVVAWGHGDVLYAVVPERGEAAATGEAEQLARALEGRAAEVRAGVAAFPEDGCDPDALLAAARDAAASANAGAVAVAAESVARIHLGDRAVVVADSAMVAVYDLLRRLAASDLPVLISGETGTGKENAAYAVHHRSTRSARRFVILNCATLQDSLVESELFGYEKGAFTGAAAAKIGLLEAARGGTVFLDEVGDLPPAAQAKLLRALETKRITRLGSVTEREVDFRIVAATNRRLEDEIADGRFRDDLFFRLSAARVVLPPLRHRMSEVPHLARHFLEEACARAGRAQATISPAAMHRLLRYAWPGNIRELKNVIEYAAALSEGDTIEPEHLPERVFGDGAAAAAPGPAAAEADVEVEREPDGAAPAAQFRPIADELRELERLRMAEALEAAGGVQTRAAQLIGMPLRTFVHKLKYYDLGGRGPASPG